LSRYYYHEYMLSFYTSTCNPIASSYRSDNLPQFIQILLSFVFGTLPVFVIQCQTHSLHIKIQLESEFREISLWNMHLHSLTIIFTLTPPWLFCLLFVLLNCSLFAVIHTSFDLPFTSLVYNESLWKVHNFFEISHTYRFPNSSFCLTNT